MLQPSEEIKSRLDILDLLSEYVQPTPAGVNFKAICPFHNEKTPSLLISKSKQVWHCFGCGEGGDVFSFIMKYEGVDFVEALRILAQKTGVALKRQDPKLRNESTTLIEICELSAKYFAYVLNKSSLAKEAREYIFEKRGLTAETVDQFKIGFAPDVKGSSKDLNNFLIKNGFTQNDVIKAGMALKSKRGFGYFDRFRNRVMFSLFDIHGRVVGFTSRILPGHDDGMRKYVNTPQTPIYNKSEIVFGLNFAKEAMRKNNLAIVVEGNMDVIALHQIGATNAVASSGTALTDQQIERIARYTTHIAFAFDMDAAGERATERAIDSALARGMNVKIIRIPESF